MQIRGDQLSAQLGQELLPVYVLHGDEPLLVLEAADVIRQKARAQGFDEREILTVLPGFDWAQLSYAGCSLSLFGGRKLIDLRIPGGKPGRDGSQALQDYAARCSADNLLLVTLPELDWKEEKAAWLQALGKVGGVVKLSAPPLGELPGWIAGRLRRQQQKAGMEGLKFMAERVEGNLLAAHQEIQKLGLLYPAGELSLHQIQEAVLNVARYRIDDLREALLAGDLDRFARTLEGLRHEGEALPLIIWALAEEIRALTQVREGLSQGKTQDALFKSIRVWGVRQQGIRNALQRLDLASLQQAMQSLMEIDLLAKGLGVGSAWERILSLGLLLCTPQRSVRV